MRELLFVHALVTRASRFGCSAWIRTQDIRTNDQRDHDRSPPPDNRLAAPEPLLPVEGGPQVFRPNGAALAIVSLLD